jgi:hypothetical protein
MMRINRPARWYGQRVRAAIAAVAVLAFPIAPAGAAGVPSARPAAAEIVPGESIGPAHLGVTAAAAASALGPSDAIAPSRRLYPRYGLIVDFDGGVAVRIGTTSMKYRTAAGAGVGTAAQDAPRLIGDDNSVTTTSGQDTAVVYAFRGVGFLFRAGRAVEAFVVPAIPFGTQKTSTIVPVSPSGAPVVLPGPGAPAGPGAPPTAAQPAGPAAPAGSSAVVLRDVTANIPSVGGLTVAGTAANAGAVPAGPLIVTATFTRASGDQVEGKTMIEGQLLPGGSAPFMIQAAMVSDIIIRYQVSVANGTGTLLAALPAQPIPSAAYAEFARRQIHIRVDLGAPSQLTGPPRVQALVSVADTGAIPPAWVQQVSVTVPYVSNGTAGSADVQLAPGQTQTVLVPAGATLGVPVVTAVALNGQ